VEGRAFPLNIHHIRKGLKMSQKRRRTRKVKIGDETIGGGSPILVQSMTSTFTTDRKATLHQAKRLVAAGCEIIRFAIPDLEAVDKLEYYKSQLQIPIVADIHFDYKLAIASLERGVDKVRINPGNLGGKDRFIKVLTEVRKRNAAIRIGVNSGSIEKSILKKYGGPCAEALAESAEGHLHIAEMEGVENVVVSIKSTDVPESVRACRRLSEITDAPQHLGVTEAGLQGYGSIKSAVGIGALLVDGIGDTIRVSLSGDPVAEIGVAFDILKAADARRETPEIIACPTCGRMKNDMAEIARSLDPLLRQIKLPIKVAIMGCVVNGPGEAKEADLGIAGGEGFGMLFRKGEALRRVAYPDMVKELMKEIKNLENKA